MSDLKKMRWEGLDLPRCECSDLPLDLIKEILAWLPVDSLCRFRSVCQEWNALITSTNFITGTWAEKPPNRNPSLVCVEVKISGSASCLFNWTWKKPSSISLSFAHNTRMEEDTHCWGSAAGLFLMEYKSEFGSEFGSAFGSAFVVCNPLTTTSLQLPPLLSIQHIERMFIEGGEGDSRDTYIVVGVGQTRNDDSVFTVEIYNSTHKSWRIAAQVKLREVRNMVYCKGNLYWQEKEDYGMGSYSIREGVSIFAPFPEMAANLVRNPYLFTCGSRLLLTGMMPILPTSYKDPDEDLYYMIWEFDKMKVNSSSSSSSWKEIARMPEEDMLGRIAVGGYGDQDIFDSIIVGVGDCVCFIWYMNESIDVVAYHIIEDTWDRLPNHILHHNGSTWFSFDECDSRINWDGDREWPVAFEPRPDMKVW